jgi:hypothetical protein
VVKVPEAKNRSKVFHVEHRGGGKIPVENTVFHVERSIGATVRLKTATGHCT